MLRQIKHWRVGGIQRDSDTPHGGGGRGLLVSGTTALLFL